MRGLPAALAGRRAPCAPPRCASCTCRTQRGGSARGRRCPPAPQPRPLPAVGRGRRACAGHQGGGSRRPLRAGTSPSIPQCLLLPSLQLRRSPKCPRQHPSHIPGHPWRLHVSTHQARGLPGAACPREGPQARRPRGSTPPTALAASRARQGGTLAASAGPPPSSAPSLLSLASCPCARHPPLANTHPSQALASMRCRLSAGAGSREV